MEIKNKLLATMAIAGMAMMATVPTSYASDDEFADLLAELQEETQEEVGTEVTSTEVDQNIDVSTGSEEMNEEKEVEIISVKDGKFSFAFEDSSGYMLGTLNEEMDVLKSISMSYEDDMEYKEVKNEDILKQFSIKTISVDGIEKNITESTVVGAGENIQISLASDSTLPGEEIEFSLSGFIPSEVYAFNLDTLNSEKVSEFKISGNSTPVVEKEIDSEIVEVNTPVEKETGAASNALLLIIASLAGYFSMRKTQKA